MKKYVAVALACCALAACGSEPGTDTTAQPVIIEEEEQTSSGTLPREVIKDICWKGTLDGSVNVLLHYQVNDDIIVGEITYLDTEQKKPVKLIGNVQEGAGYRLLEFEPNGNISGIITGNPRGSTFNGEWYSPKSGKNLVMELSKVDTLVKSAPIEEQKDNIYGKYYYQYSAAGSQGELNINKVAANTIAFDIFSLTDEPARNMAEIPADTISMTGTQLIYELPGSEGCAFKARFYKGFVVVNYTKGDCGSTFGHNASVEGIFLKLE